MRMIVVTILSWLVAWDMSQENWVKYFVSTHDRFVYWSCFVFTPNTLFTIKGWFYSWKYSSSTVHSKHAPCLNITCSPSIFVSTVSDIPRGKWVSSNKTISWGWHQARISHTSELPLLTPLFERAEINITSSFQYTFSSLCCNIISIGVGHIIG